MPPTVTEDPVRTTKYLHPFPIKAIKAVQTRKSAEFRDIKKESHRDERCIWHKQRLLRPVQNQVKRVKKGESDDIFGNIDSEYGIDF